ncbi:MAG: DUF3791 domain-containing protein [Duncaniella sp.]|nr:DUF3791 domain-containing protein [Duncaniella sp.]
MKKDNELSTLGACIRMERRKAGLTQAQLGNLIGLKESRVSKIENGAPITPEVASFILGKMGSKLQLKVVPQASDDNKASAFIMSVIHYFAKIKNLSLSKAFGYLTTFKGIEYLERYMDIEQSLSYEDITVNLSRICANNGGAL